MIDIEDEVQIVPLAALARQSSDYVKIHPDMFPHYDVLRAKIHFLHIMALLKCEGHPFFEGHPDVFEEVKTFCDDLFTSK